MATHPIFENRYHLFNSLDILGCIFSAVVHGIVPLKYNLLCLSSKVWCLRLTWRTVWNTSDNLASVKLRMYLTSQCSQTGEIWWKHLAWFDLYSGVSITEQYWSTNTNLYLYLYLSFVFSQHNRANTGEQAPKMIN